MCAAAGAPPSDAAVAAHALCMPTLVRVRVRARVRVRVRVRVSEHGADARIIQL